MFNFVTFEVLSQLQSLVFADKIQTVSLSLPKIERTGLSREVRKNNYIAE